MKFTVVALAAAGIASAQNARVVNNCKDTIYVQSVPPKGAAGPLTTLTAGKTFSEKFRTEAGSTIKIAKTRSLDNPLFFGYSFDAHNIFYEFSTQFGNPFAGNHNVLDAGEGCQAFDCKANDANCYSRPPSQPHKVYHCPPPANLTATICK